MCVFVEEHGSVPKSSARVQNRFLASIVVFSSVSIFLVGVVEPLISIYMLRNVKGVFGS